MIDSDARAQRCFIVEGNIGAGKTTFLRLMREYLNVQLVYEPLDKWQHVVDGQNLLDKFYSDTTRWAYTFQTYAFVTRVMAQEQHARINTYPAQVLERSVFSDRYCFAQTAFDLGTMSALEWKLYCDWFSWLVDNYVTKPVGFIYLQTNPSICYDRLKMRNRSEETEIPFDYIKRLHDKHESWLIAKDGVAEYIRDTPVLTLHCDADFEHSREEFENHMQRVVDFMMQQKVVDNPFMQRSLSSSL